MMAVFKERFSKLRVQLLLEYPFYAYLLLSLEFEATSEQKVPTIATDGVKAYLNLEWITALTEDELRFVLCHEVLHCALQHILRRKKRQELLWNYAADIVTNRILQSDSIGKLPEGVVSPNAVDIRGSAEEIYQHLLKNAIEIPANYAFDYHIYDTDEGKVESDNSKQREWAIILSHAKAYAMNRGVYPLGIEQELVVSLEGYFPWQRMLAEFLDQSLQYDISFSQPNKRFISRDLYLPSPIRENINIIIGLDTSGSISIEEMQFFLRETFAILQKIHNCSIKVIQCDAVIQKVESFNNTLDPIPTTVIIKGRGGTDFRPVFEFAGNEELLNVLLYFTDGDGKLPDFEPDFPVIWVLTANRKLPWGKSVFFHPQEFYSM